MKTYLIEDETFRIYNKILEHKNTILTNRYEDFELIYQGNHAILNKTVSNMNRANNRLVVNHVRSIINSYNAYFLGNSVTINHKMNDRLQEVVKDILDENEFDSILSEIGKESAIKGKSYLLAYLDENGDMGLSKVSPENMIVSKDLKGRVVEAIRFYYLNDFYTNAETLYIEHYTDSQISYFEKKSTENTIKLVKTEVNKFNFTPVVEFLNNTDGQGEVKNIEGLNDAYNLLQSLMLDDHQAHSNAYFVLKNADLSDEGKKLIAESSIISLFDNGDCSFLTKDLHTESLEATLSRIEKDLYKIAEIPNMTDENFSGNLSGVAIKYRLISLEHKTKNKERLFKKAIKNLLGIMRQYIFLTTNITYVSSEFNVVFSRNLPVNILEELQSCTQMKLLELLPDEVILSQLSFVDNPQEILALYKQQEEDKFTSFNTGITE